MTILPEEPSTQKPELPAALRGYVDDRPRAFSGVEWPEFADVRERVRLLERDRDERSQKSSMRNTIYLSIFIAVLSSALSPLFGVAFESFKTQNNQSKPEEMDQYPPKEPGQ